MAQEGNVMATYVLMHGAASDSWYWHLVAPELQNRGHTVIAPDLPSDDAAGLSEYADAVVDAVGTRSDLIVVAQSMAGLSAPLVTERVPVRLLVMLNAMTPVPGEPPGEWWANTGWEELRREQLAREGHSDDDADFDVVDLFFHDVPPDVVAEAMAAGERAQSGTPFEKPWPLMAWPDVPTRFLQGRDDRFFPVEFQRRVVRDRLGITIDEMDGGHLVALSRPQELAERLETYRAGVSSAQ